MSRNSTPSLGALHPVLFLLLVYIVSFVLAFFVCRMIYFSINGEEPTSGINTKVGKLETLTAAK